MNKEENNIKYFTDLIEDNKTHKYDYRKYYTPIFDKRLENILNLISKLQKENDKLQKVISLMAEDRAELSEDSVIPTCKEAIIDFYFKQVEDKNEKK